MRIDRKERQPKKAAHREGGGRGRGIGGGGRLGKFCWDSFTETGFRWRQNKPENKNEPENYKILQNLVWNEAG